VTDKSSTVTIVGAGIIGIACAHYLAEAGFEVTIVERGKVASACSKSNCGYICPSHALPLTEPGAFKTAFRSLFNPTAPFRVKPSWNPALFKWMFQFAKRCTHKQMLAAGKPTQRGMDSFAKTDDLVTSHFGIAATRIAGADLPEFDPGLKSGLAGAFLYPGDTSVRPDKLNTEWIQHLKNNNVTFVEECELKSVRQEAGRVAAIETSKGDFESEHFVFAFGAWAAKWGAELGCAIPVQPGKGYSVTLDRPEHAPRHPVLFPEHKVGVSVFDDGFRLGSMMEFAGYDTKIPDFRIEQLRNSAKPYLVASVDGEARSKWYGWRPMTWDSLPIIGQVPSMSNAFLATGHNMLGLSLAPATGKLLAELVTGQKPHLDPDPYCPDRF